MGVPKRNGALSHTANLFGHRIQGNTVGTADVTLLGIIRPGTENQHATGCNGIEEMVGRLIKITETIVCKNNERVLLCKESVLYLFFIG